VRQFVPKELGKNIAKTPWLSDMIIEKDIVLFATANIFRHASPGAITK
jgi:hypothetical protein